MDAIKAIKHQIGTLEYFTADNGEKILSIMEPISDATSHQHSPNMRWLHNTMLHAVIEGTTYSVPEDVCDLLQVFSEPEHEGLPINLSEWRLEPSNMLSQHGYCWFEEPLRLAQPDGQIGDVLALIWTTHEDPLYAQARGQDTTGDCIEHQPAVLVTALVSTKRRPEGEPYMVIDCTFGSTFMQIKDVTGDDPAGDASVPAAPYNKLLAMFYLLMAISQQPDVVVTAMKVDRAISRKLEKRVAAIPQETTHSHLPNHTTLANYMGIQGRSVHILEAARHRTSGIERLVKPQVAAHASSAPEELMPVVNNSDTPHSPIDALAQQVAAAEAFYTVTKDNHPKQQVNADENIRWVK